MNYQDIAADLPLFTGTCDTTVNLRRVSQALQLLANSSEGMWDGLIASMDVSAQDGEVTLPRDVLLPLAINIDCLPTFPRDRWFIHHLNGPGTSSYQTKRAWDDRGNFSFFKEFAAPTGSSDTSWKIKVTSTNAADNGDVVRVVYQDTDERRVTATFTLNSATPQVSTVYAKKLFEFYRPAGDGDVKVWQYIDGVDDILVGWFYPNETTPSYRRIRVNASSSIRMTYRRRAIELTSVYDFIPLDNPMALLQAVRSIDYRMKGKLADAQAHQVDAVGLLEQEQSVRNLYTPVGPQIMDYSSWNNESLWNDYSTGGY